MYKNKKMENNKFNKYYLKISLDALLKKVLYHRIEEEIIDTEWYEALKIHLEQREMSIATRNMYEKIINTELELLRKEKEGIQLEIKKTAKYEDNSNKITIKKSAINEAGTLLKVIVYAASILIFCTLIGISILLSTEDPKLIKNSYVFIAFLNITCYIIILISLYKAGDQLENS
jgi:hypothetical protein